MIFMMNIIGVIIKKNMSLINYCDTPLGIDDNNDNNFEIAYEGEDNKYLLEIKKKIIDECNKRIR